MRIFVRFSNKNRQIRRKILGIGVFLLFWIPVWVLGGFTDKYLVNIPPKTNRNNQET